MTRPVALALILLSLGAASAETMVKVEQTELDTACSYEQTSSDDIGKIIGCAEQCWKAASVIGPKTTDIRANYWLALIISLSILALVNGAAFVAIARMAGKAGWDSPKRMGAQLGTALLALGLGLGVSMLASDLAVKDVEASLFLDACALKKANVTGSAWSGANRMTCTHQFIRDRVVAEGRQHMDLLTPFAAFRGVDRELEPVATNAEPEQRVADIRHEQLSKFLAAADKLDPASQCGAEIAPITNSGPLRLVRDGVKFPGSPLVASALALVLGALLSLAWRLARR